jgi:hypothetical protein
LGKDISQWHPIVFMQYRWWGGEVWCQITR